jgi:hypothetical protein
MIGYMVLFLHLAVGVMGQGQGGSNPRVTNSGFRVLEDKASARFEEDGLRVTLPFSAPAGSGVQVTAWLAAPNDARSGEKSIAIRTGERAATLTLDWPSDAKGKRVDDVSWYRVMYRIDANGAETAHGILSVGAIAANLMELRLAKPVSLVAGNPIQLRVYACNPITRVPFSGVHLKATLELESNSSDEDESSKKTIIREAVTDGSGEALLTFPKKGAVIEKVSITVDGSLKSFDGGYAKASVYSNLATDYPTEIHIDTDKPLHKPGETVHLRALVQIYGQTAVNKALSLTIEDPDNKTLLEVPLTTNRFGIAAYDWKTSAQLATGDYRAAFKADEAEDGTLSNQDIRIQRYDLPEFAVSAAMDRGYYLEGQTPVAHIHAGYLFGKPVAAGKVRVAHASGREWNPNTRQLETKYELEETAALDANGDAEVRLDVKEDYKDFKENESSYAYGRFQDVEFRAIVTDTSSGRSEPLKFKVRLSHDPVHTYIRQLDGDMSEGDFVVTTSHAEGGPVSCKVTLDWLDDNGHTTPVASAVTSRYGLAKVYIHFPRQPNDNSYHSYKIRLTARDAEGHLSRFDDSVDSDYPPIWFSVTHTLLKPSQPIEAVVHAPQGITLDIDAYSRDGLLRHQQIHMSHTMEPVEIPASAAFHGKITLTACQMNGIYSNWESCSSKSVLYPEDRALKVRLTGLQHSYLPGAEVNAGVNLQGTAGVMGVSVFDTAVEQRAKTEEDENDRWSGSKWWLNDNNVEGVTEDELNRIDTSKPIPADLDLVAEDLIGNSSVLQVTIQNNHDEYKNQRNTYELGMKKALKPLGDAILSAKPERLPTTREVIEKIARVAKLDDALLDPWNTPYHVATKVEWSNEVVSLVSAGPDKRFGTDDDFTLELTTRNYFELPGERLTALVRNAVKAGEPLPANEKELKALARADGFDLDTTLDPQGKPYHYQLQARVRAYTIQAFPHDSVVQKDGNYDCCAAWNSPSIDYFSQTETRLGAALHAWNEAGKFFPATEAEARQAFAAAGIDFDSLRDPFGHPYKLLATTQMIYTRVESVKAGAALDEKSKYVTHKMHAIKVLLSGGTGIENMMTQFQHPYTEQSGSDLKPHAVDEGTFTANTGAIVGVVTDQTGAIVQGADISVVNPATGFTAAGITNATGLFQITDLTPGLYTVKATAKGFEAYILTEVSVSWSTLTTVDVKLTLGAETQTVSVTADALQVQTNSSVVSTIVKNPGTDAHAKTSAPAFTPRLRHVFEETAYWTPSLETDAQGHAALKFTLPDSLTTWKLHAIGSTLDGRVTSIDRTFITFQPFFVDMDPPQVLTVGDEISLPVNLRNYTPHAVTLPVTVKAADWFTLSTPAVTQMTVPSGGSSAMILGLNAKARTDAGALNVSAANAHDGDAVEKKVKVHPDGEPRMVTASELLRGSKSTVHFDLPPETIPGSVHAEMLLYPNLGTNVFHAMKAVLERPYGCGEQTISSTYPSLLFLELAAAAKTESPAKAQAQDYLQLGYDRLMGYFNAAGGLTYWGHDSEEADVALTAYAIEFLTEAEPYVDVDRSRITSAIEWLLNQQSADGSWKPHYGQPSARQVLFIASALETVLEAKDFGSQAKGDLPGRIKQAIAIAQAYAANSVAALHDSYANSLRLTLAAKTGDKAAVVRLREELVATADHGRNGAHWEFDGYSPFYGWGTGGKLEATAMALSALDAAANIDDTKLEDDALLYLLENRDGYGVWLSGQATVRVLKALLPVAVKQLQNPSPADFTLAVNGQSLSAVQAQSIKSDSRLIDAPRTLDLTAMVHAGTNTLEFSGAGDAAIANAQITTWFYLPWSAATLGTNSTTVPGKSSGLDFGYSCDAENAKVGQPIPCTVSARRIGSQGYGMLLAEVGLPPGADVDRAALSKLLDTWTIDRYEIQPDRIVFYLWPSSAEGVKFSFSFTPRYAIRAKAAPAKLTDYYNPDLNAVLAPMSFVVSAAPN